jgi:hypothetical protein
LRFVVDGVGGHDQVHLALFDELLAVGGDGLNPFNLVSGDAQLGGEQLADFDVETDRLAVQALLAEQWLVELGSDGHLAGRGELFPWWYLQRSWASRPAWGWNRSRCRRRRKRSV